MRMRKLTDDFIDELLKEAPKPEPRKRKRKVLERNIRNWFYEVDHSAGQCENPSCTDPRKFREVMVAMVNEKRMCRFCFLAGWNAPKES